MKITRNQLLKIIMEEANLLHEDHDPYFDYDRFEMGFDQAARELAAELSGEITAISNALENLYVRMSNFAPGHELPFDYLLRSMLSSRDLPRLYGPLEDLKDDYLSHRSSAEDISWAPVGPRDLVPHPDEHIDDEADIEGDAFTRGR